ncbi:hypothetical protein E4U19_001502 [Claviceps sp. Clav32 group G5]|nr:hypothetical protein E4U19_001502 [Claviceps sp. Clav32 group G5]
MMASATWGGQDQHMATSATEEELNHLFDMSGMATISETMQFDFHGFQDGASQAIMAQQHHHHHQQQQQQQQKQQQQQQQQQQEQQQQPDTIMADADISHILPRSDGLLQNHAPTMTSATGMPNQLLGTSAPGDSISSIDAQILYLQQQKFHQQQRQLQEQRVTFFAPPTHHHHSVPSTPRSLDLPPGSGQFYSQTKQMSQRSYDRRYHQPMSEQQDMALTPLVSPAVTPLDQHFNIDNAFAVPGAYFSPLTSPALHAQNDASSVYDYSTQSNNSPVEMDLEAPIIAVPLPPAPSVGRGTEFLMKSRKNSAVKARGNSGIKNSPIAKPQRRRTGPSPAIMSQVLNELDESILQSSDHGFLPMPATSSTDSSEENASVSPEYLTDMPPPPVPSRRSNSRSPYIQAQHNGSQQPTPRSLTEEQNQRRRQQQHQPQPHPATPASLMKLAATKTKTTQSPTVNAAQNTVTENIESLELPQSIANQPIAPFNTSTVSASPRIEPISSGSTFSHQQQELSHSLATQAQTQNQTPGTASTTQSPQIHPGSSDPNSARIHAQPASRNSRKRSTGSVHASPALLPRISPNLKPLLPGSPLTSMEDTASRLLMTKSNYQNILEGNTVPGVFYPTELSTNLTSKRTSHKIAEQGRRNRINSALQIMASLLPDQQKLKECAAEEAAEAKEKKSEKGEKGEKGENKGDKGNLPNSKASVVESAIVHMKHLQEENGQLREEVEVLKRELERVRGGAGS